jgi:hypothetical protein
MLAIQSVQILEGKNGARMNLTKFFNEVENAKK